MNATETNLKTTMKKQALRSIYTILIGSIAVLLGAANGECLHKGNLRKAQVLNPDSENPRAKKRGGSEILVALKRVKTEDGYIGATNTPPARRDNKKKNEEPTHEAPAGSKVPKGPGGATPPGGDSGGSGTPHEPQGCEQVPGGEDGGEGKPKEEIADDTPDQPEGGEEVPGDGVKGKPKGVANPSPEAEGGDVALKDEDEKKRKDESRKAGNVPGGDDSDNSRTRRNSFSIDNGAYPSVEDSLKKFREEFNVDPGSISDGEDTPDGEETAPGIDDSAKGQASPKGTPGDEESDREEDRERKAGSKKGASTDERADQDEDQKRKSANDKANQNGSDQIVPTPKDDNEGLPGSTDDEQDEGDTKEAVGLEENDSENEELNSPRTPRIGQGHRHSFSLQGKDLLSNRKRIEKAKQQRVRAMRDRNNSLPGKSRKKRIEAPDITNAEILNKILKEHCGTLEVFFKTRQDGKKSYKKTRELLVLCGQELELEFRVSGNTLKSSYKIELVKEQSENTEILAIEGWPNDFSLGKQSDGKGPNGKATRKKVTCQKKLRATASKSGTAKLAFSIKMKLKGGRSKTLNFKLPITVR